MMSLIISPKVSLFLRLERLVLTSGLLSLLLLPRDLDLVFRTTVSQ